MAEDDDRPFVCSEPNCSMRFVNEDHLSVHKMKHEMSLSLFPGGSKASSNLLFVDQTPTPTKFLRNCEEIGLFSDLSKNPFEEAFKKAADTVHDIKTDGPNLPGPDAGEVLHTPHPPHLLPQAHVPKISPLARTEPRSVPVIVVSQDTPPGSVAPLPVASVAPPLPGPSADLQSTIEVKSPLPPKKAMLAKQVKEEEEMKVKSPTTPSVVLQSPVSNNSSEGKSNQYVLQVLVQMPGGELVPVQIPASVAPSSASSCSTPATISMANTSTAAVTMTTTTGLASVTTKQKLKAAIQQNSASTSGIQRLPEVKVTDLKGQQPSGSKAILTNPVPIKIEQNYSSQLSMMSSDSENSMGFNCDESDSSASKRRRTMSIESGDGDPDDRRKKFLERNRAAAARCRQKKKAWIGNLENKADDLQSLNVRLQNEVTVLKSEVAQLKGLLLAHKDCPITVQQQQQGNFALAQSPSLETQSDSISSTSQNAALALEKSNCSPPETVATSALAAMATRTLTTNQTFTIITVPSTENS